MILAMDMTELTSWSGDDGTLSVDPRLPGFDPGTPRAHRADAHWVVRGETGQVTARASLWHRDAPGLPGERVGVIGHYAAVDAAAGEALLRRACAELAAAGCTLAVGPMDGNTWRSYRFVTEPGSEPPFFLEPANSPTWPTQWQAAGFAPLAEYHSTVTDDLSDLSGDPRQAAAALAVERAGVRVRPLDFARWDEELRRVYAVAAVSFRENFLYTPLSEEDFLDLYRPLRPLARPELVFLAEDVAGQPVGFALGLPDVLNHAVPTAIVKTVAVLPDRAGIGLGRVLVGAVQDAARTLGCRRVIHALMHDGNVSRHLSARFGVRLLRRYTLFARPLP